jgi:hypothetical protein
MNHRNLSSDLVVVVILLRADYLKVVAAQAD